MSPTLAPAPPAPRALRPAAPPHRAGVLIAPLESDAGGDGAPLYLQVYHRIRDAILKGGLPAGERLPSERTLAADLSISRTTVEVAYRQLASEGYLVRHVGSGSYVSDVFPERQAAASARPAARRASPRPPLSRRGERLAEAGSAMRLAEPLLFASCVPAVELFPSATWNRLAARRMRRGGSALLRRADPAGLRLLREAIAAHVAAARGVRCDWRQVVVTSGTQQALDVAARLLLDDGDAVWLEDPGYVGALAALRGAGARVVPVPVDAEGMDVCAGVAREPAARLAYVSPSHQFPIGATLSIQRRLALLAWAAASDAWIFEDDYDNEFRVSGRPLVALQGLDERGRVIYGATFNKALFPGLRMAFCVVPEAIAEPFLHARAAVDGGTSTLLQAVLADFILDGHLAGHVRRMRQLYRERRDAFVAACRAHLDGMVTLGQTNTGLQTVLWLPDGAEDADASRRARDAGVDAPPISRFRIDPGGRPGLLLTYGGEPPERIDAGIRALAAALEPRPRR